MQEIIFKIRHFERGLSKNLKQVNSIFLLHPVLFMDNFMKRGLNLVTNLTSLFSGLKTFRKIPFLVIFHLRNLKQSGFRVIPKIIFANLCKTIHDETIIPVSDSLNLENVENKGGKITKI